METVHVFLEHDEISSDAGGAFFLYPFLGNGTHAAADPQREVAGSVRMKVAEDARLRERVAAEETERMLDFDCVCPPNNMRPVPALSLSAEPAALTAIANDVGMEAGFLRQLIAHARPEDVATGISTSGSSRNLLTCFEEARRRKLLTIALLGYDGGDVVKQNLVDIPLIVRSDYIPRIQEVQASTYHVMRELLDDVLRRSIVG